VSSEILDKASQKIFADYHQRIRDIQVKIKDDRVAGEAALRRLLPIAQGSTGQSERVARILLGCYNGIRFPLDLTNLRSLDYEIMEDVMAVLRMDANAYREVHCYFENGGKVFEKMAYDWGFSLKGSAA
jgi:hypothetical protein